MKRLMIALFIVILTGCTLTPPSIPPVAIYDLGLIATHTEPVVAKKSSNQTTRLLFKEITSPIWLNSQEIHYRLAYYDPAQLYSYANSRWAAAPAALLTRQISNHIQSHTEFEVVRSADGVQAEYFLHATLEDFSQIYESADTSHAYLHLNVSLIERRTRTLQTQRHFIIQKTAPTANAAGAVYALIEASNELKNEITDWVTNALVTK
ncbi:MAG: ABC-type transport auxiliary lipoprotein family protein [Nitrosomonas sp.]|nr:ABC-type transport auxiliary lipoprotein family protein [Nitrosomonas sp.]